MRVGYSFLLAMTVLSGSACVSKAASPAGPPPDVTKDPKAVVGNDWNLGPTGMRGWMFVRDNYTDEARQIVVTKIDRGSPAAGVMKLGDVILGVGEKTFAEDARRAFGRAIGDAETEQSQGLLNLLVWRKGAQKQINVKLRVMGAYSDTAPYDCPKSKKILDDGCRYIAEGLAKGQTENRCHIAHLALLASGNPAYRDELKTYAHKLGNPNAKFSIAHWVPGAPGGWTTGYTCVYLSEYYLATGDAYVLPLIKEYAHFIALGQSRIGSWASNMAWTDLNGGVVHGNLPGYGALNQAGLVCHMGLILAKKCGTEDPEIDQALDRANKFFGYYIGKGTIPYGDHNPTLNCHDDNGKNCEGALVFDLQGMKEGSQFFTKLATASYEDREEGHTGNTFSHQWAGPGVARGGPKAAAAFLKKMRWYYDSARCWNGSFIRELAPDILFSIEQKAPSGEMFAGGVRLAGVKMLAKHRIKEGIPLCFTAMDWRNWGAGERIAVCLDTLKQYGAHALPLLKEIERTWTVDEVTQNSLKPQLAKLREVIRAAENDKNPPKLISIKDLGAQKGTLVIAGRPSPVHQATGLLRIAAGGFGTEHSALWGEHGEKWTPESRLPDFSFAGYHCGEKSLPITAK